MIPTGKRLITILGMHRSGTSAITRGLNVLGVELGDRLMPPKEGNNAKGFFEDIDLNALNTEMLQTLGSDWHYLAPIEPGNVESLHQKGYFLRAVDLLRQKTADVSTFGFKDPRLSKLLPFWQQVFAHCGFDTGYVLAIRNPLSVAQSLAKRDGFNHEKSYMLWLGHVLASLSHTEAHSRVLVDYDHFLDAPQKSMEILSKRLALRLDPQALQFYQSEFLDKGLRHTLYDINDLAKDQACPPLVQELYAALLDSSRDIKQIDQPAFHARTALWVNEFERLTSSLRLADQFSAQIANLNQSIVVHDRKITDLLRAALEQDQNVFQKLFDPEWYKKKYPDIDTAGVEPYQHYVRYGVREGRIPSTDLTTFVSHGVLDRLKELSAQVNQGKSLSEVQLAELAERENAFSQKLQETQQAHEQQKGEQSREHAEREQAYLAQLAQTRQQIETQLLQMAEREKVFSQQLQEIQQAHEQQKGEQSREHAAREQDYLAQLGQARQQIEAQLLELAEREKAFSQHLREIQQAHEQQTVELSGQHIEREQALNVQLRASEDKLHSMTYRWEEEKKAHVMALGQLHAELNAMRTTRSWRWTSPLRSLVTLLPGEKADGRKPVSTEAPMAERIASLAAPSVKTTLPMQPQSNANKTKGL